MTVPHGHDSVPLPLVDRPSQRPDAGFGGQMLPYRNVFPGVPDEAWVAYDKQALTAEEMLREDVGSTPELVTNLAQSIAEVMATSAGTDRNFSDAVVGPRGRHATFRDAFSGRLARLARDAQRAGSDVDRRGAMSMCEGDLARYLKTGMKRQPGLVHVGPLDGRSAELVWVWGTDRQGQNPAWRQERLGSRADFLAATAASMFVNPLALGGSERELPVGPALDQQALRITAFNRGGTLSDQEALSRAARWARRQLDNR